MDEALGELAAACTTFVGSHFLLSGWLRAPALRMLGRSGFLVLYSLIAAGTLGWAILAFDRAPLGSAWWDGGHPVPWVLASLMSLVAMFLLLGAFNSNPALPSTNISGLTTVRPWGVFRITRHPMMMGIAIWAVSHVIISPTLRSAIFNLSLALLAVVGAAAQDRRKLALNRREWSVWTARTPFWPDPRRAGGNGNLWAAAVLAWLVVTAAHLWLAGVPAGIWILTD